MKNLIIGLATCVFVSNTLSGTVWHMVVSSGASEPVFQDLPSEKSVQAIEKLTL